MSETYTRINWKDGEDGGTPLSEYNLNLMDLGIEKAHQLIEELKENGVGGVTEEQLKNAVDAYFIKNPIQTVSDIFMRVSDGYIQFSTDNLTWKNVIAVSELKGQTGKTAYEYAKDGGYTGTEEEFAKKLAQENPTREEFSQLQDTVNDLKENGTDTGSGVTTAQANSLWVVVQKTAFVEQLTDEELTAFKIAWGIDVVTVPCAGITLNTTTLSFTDTTSQTLIATVEPNDTTDKVVWTSNNNSVVTVTNGVVKPLSNGSAIITATCGSVSATCEATVAMTEDEQITLSSISATYTGGDVTSGTALTDLTGITVTATYSDGSIANVTGYTLSGDILVGENTITVSYGGKTTTFTVTGVAESTGGESVEMTNYGEYNWIEGTEYSDGGTTAYSGTVGTSRGSFWCSEVFDKDTEVSVTILYGATNANLRQYCACVSSEYTLYDGVYASNKPDLHYLAQIGTASTSEYTATYTVRAGYRLAIINYNSGIPQSINVVTV